jgi:hypothetical protein
VSSESRLPLIIFGLLVLLILAPLGFWKVRETLRPKLAEARIVTATDHDPVFRDGPRRVPAGHDVRVAVALRLHRALRGDVWLAPVEQLELGGEPVKHVESAEWPVASRELRVFWFTVESTNVGGELRPENAASKLRYRNFLAPEMGGGLAADAFPEAHNDDELGLPPETTPEGSGTIRLYARIEVFDPERGLHPLQAISTETVDGLPDPGFPAVHRSIDVPDGIDPTVGELFLLPGFEPRAEPPGAWNEVTVPGLGSDFMGLVERRLVVSSRTFAAVAVAGMPELDGGLLEPLGTVGIADGTISRTGRPIRWGDDVQPGDLLAAGSHWIVLAADDGTGLLDGADRVLHCWRRPPGANVLSEAVDEGVISLELYRHGR